MKQFIFFLAVAAAISVEKASLTLPTSASGFYPTEVFNVLDFGDIPNNSTLNTDAINQAISKANQQGGGFVLFPPGAYFTGTIHL